MGSGLVVWQNGPCLKLPEVSTITLSLTQSGIFPATLKLSSNLTRMIRLLGGHLSTHSHCISLGYGCAGHPGVLVIELNWLFLLTVTTPPQLLADEVVEDVIAVVGSGRVEMARGEVSIRVVGAAVTLGCVEEVVGLVTVVIWGLVERTVVVVAVVRWGVVGSEVGEDVVEVVVVRVELEVGLDVAVAAVERMVDVERELSRVLVGRH